MVLARSLSNSTSTPLTRALAAYRKLDLSGSRSKSGRQATPRQHHRRAIRLNTSQLVQLVERYEAGSSLNELAAHFNINRRTVSQHLKLQGVKLRGQSPTAAEIDQMVWLYGAGLSLARVGERLGFDAHTVQTYLRRVGFPMRDRTAKGESELKGYALA